MKSPNSAGYYALASQLSAAKQQTPENARTQVGLEVQTRRQNQVSNLYAMQNSAAE